MFGIGQTELLVILVFAFLLFGPDKLPQMGRTIGRALRQFRETQQKVTSVVQTEIVDPMAAAATAEAAKPKPVPSGADDAAEAAGEGVEGADIATQKAAEARKETFAERRARLAAEKAAREAAPQAADAAAPADAAADEGADTAEAEQPAAEQSAAASEPVRTTADLYARRPHRRRAAEAEEATEAPAEDAAPQADDADAAAPEVAPAEAQDLNTADPEGGER